MRTNKAIKINWIYGGEAGSWVSSELRFEIFPAGFRHTTTPDGYELSDRVMNQSYPVDSVSEAKAVAVDIMKKLIHSY